jgi:hypothetical protein
MRLHDHRRIVDPAFHFRGEGIIRASADHGDVLCKSGRGERAHGRSSEELGQQSHWLSFPWLSGREAGR